MRNNLGQASQDPPATAATGDKPGMNTVSTCSGEQGYLVKSVRLLLFLLLMLQMEAIHA